MATCGWGRGPWSSAGYGLGCVITPPVGALALSGVAPSVVVGDIITPSVGALALAGVAPIVLDGVIISPPVGALALEGHAPTIDNPNWVIIDTTQVPNWVPVVT